MATDSRKAAERAVSDHLYAIRDVMGKLNTRQRKAYLKKVEAYNCTNCGFVQHWAREFLATCLREAKWDDKFKRAGALKEQQ